MLENEVHGRITMLAWPFGIHDPFLEDRAAAMGYAAAFSIECRAATSSDSLMSLPPCLVFGRVCWTTFPFIHQSCGGLCQMNLLTRTLTGLITFASIIMPASTGQPQSKGEMVGTVMDCRTRQPISGAWITVGTHAQRTDASGQFKLGDKAE
jgi:hypothetical protein